MAPATPGKWYSNKTVLGSTPSQFKTQPIDCKSESPEHIICKSP